MKYQIFFGYFIVFLLLSLWLMREGQSPKNYVTLILFIMNIVFICLMISVVIP